MNDELLERAVRANHELFLLTSDRTEADLAGLGLTHATAAALIEIDPGGDPPTMKVLAERLYCNAPNLTFLIDQLVTRGLVERAVAANDRRQRAVLLTEKGERTREAVLGLTLTTSPLRHLGERDRLAVATALEGALAKAKEEPRRT